MAGYLCSSASSLQGRQFSTSMAAISLEGCISCICFTMEMWSLYAEWVPAWVNLKQGFQYYESLQSLTALASLFMSFGLGKLSSQSTGAVHSSSQDDMQGFLTIIVRLQKRPPIPC